MPTSQRKKAREKLPQREAVPREKQRALATARNPLESSFGDALVKVNTAENKQLQDELRKIQFLGEFSNAAQSFYPCKNLPCNKYNDMHVIYTLVRAA